MKLVKFGTENADGKKYLLLIVALCFNFLFLQSIIAQERIRFDPGIAKTQYGFSTRLVFDFDRHNYTNVRLGFATGIGFNYYSTNMTSLNLEYSVLVGGLGTFNNKNSSYLVIAPHFCQSIDKKDFSSNEEALYNNQPLYYFTDLVTPPLQNQFRKSISIGANFVCFFNKRIIHRWQRVAHAGLKINEVQVVYNNDGGSLLKIWGDKQDRYFTGSGFLKVHLKENQTFNDFGISFYKFTGFTPQAFEVSDELLFTTVDYRDAEENLFNRGFWSFQLGNSRYGDVFFRINNPRNIKEFQNFIHYGLGFSYHENATDRYYSFGGSLSYYNTNITKL